MQKSIDIGTPIDLEDLIESRMLIQANSGGGKSGIARVMMEECSGKIPFIVIDKKGEYYTLKENDGDIIVIGGPNGDIPISMQAAKMLAKHIISNGLTVIIDMISFTSNDQRSIFIKDFLIGLMNLGQEYWTPYLIFIEEAHMWCGQQVKTPSGPMIRELMTEGRKMGFCGILLTQRISKLHKDAAAECNNKFIGRTFLDIDIARSANEMGLIGQDKFKLRELKPRHFWAFGTSIQPNHVHEVTVKIAKSKFPKGGAIMTLKTQKPTEKIKKAISKLNDLPKEAEKEKKTINELQSENTRLRTELTRANKSISNKPEPSKQAPIDHSKVVQPLKDQITLLKNQVTEKDKTIRLYKEVTAGFQKIMGIIHQTAEKGKSIELPKNNVLSEREKRLLYLPETSPQIKPIDPIIKLTGPQSRPIVSKSNGQMGKCSREVLRFLAQYPERQFSKAQVAIATGYSSGSGGFNNTLSELNQKGFIIRSGKLQVNEEAMEEIENHVGPLTPQEYNIETYKKNLNKCEREIYEVLLQQNDRSFTKQELSQATQTSYSADSGGFNNSLSRLNTLELIVRQNAQIKLNPELLELI